jgi:putative membrane protein insertion efficiency factor
MDHHGGAGRVLGFAIAGMIRAYQLLVAPIVPPSCRYYPSCSHYAAEAVLRHGPWHGSLFAVRRLLRCHPWGGSGYDPVPFEASPQPSPQTTGRARGAATRVGES